jgi:hypothetical protein
MIPRLAQEYRAMVADLARTLTGVNVDRAGAELRKLVGDCAWKRPRKRWLADADRRASPDAACRRLPGKNVGSGGTQLDNCRVRASLWPETRPLTYGKAKVVFFGLFHTTAEDVRLGTNDVGADTIVLQAHAPEQPGL